MIPLTINKKGNFVDMVYKSDSDYFKIHDELEDEFYNQFDSKTKDGTVGCIVVLGGLFISWIIICISNLFDSKIGYVLAIGLTLFLVYVVKEDAQKDPRETLFKAEIKYKELYHKVYNSAKNNFVPPGDIYMLRDIIQTLKCEPL